MDNKIEYTFDEMVARLHSAIQCMDGNSLAELWNSEFGEGLTYLGNDTFVQEGF